MTVDVVLVRWACVTSVPDHDDTLDAAARERCERLRQLGDRRRFVGARMLLRRTVAERAGCDEADVAIVQRCLRCGGPHGAPGVLVRDRPGPAVSMSHAGELAVVAVSRAAVGVDVEPHRDDLDVRGWVRAEAILKATGRGFDIDPASRLRSPMRVADVSFGGGYAGAVARLGRRRLHTDVAEADLALTT